MRTCYGNIIQNFFKKIPNWLPIQVYGELLPLQDKITRREFFSFSSEGSPIKGAHNRRAVL